MIPNLQISPCTVALVRDTRAALLV